MIDSVLRAKLQLVFEEPVALTESQPLVRRAKRLKSRLQKSAKSKKMRGLRRVPINGGIKARYR